jgi:beta-lactamase regulating signal transducer with metallopeptidase domain
MSDRHFEFATWLLQSLAAGGFVLLLASMSYALVRQPVRRRQTGAWAVRVALLVPALMLLPSWIYLPRFVKHVEPAEIVYNQQPEAQEAVAEPSRPNAEASAPVYYVPVMPLAAETPVDSHMAATEKQPPAPPALPEPAIAAAPMRMPDLPWRSLLLVAYLSGAGFLLLRFCLGYFAVWKMLRRSRPAGERLQSQLALQLEPGESPPRLLVSAELQVPVCCGLFRPAIVFPEALAREGSEQALRWVFAHELAHLRRNDVWTSFWLNLAKVIYFPIPWFWWLRAKITLAQEFVADANAAALTNRADDYASFLLDLSRRLALPRPRLATATGVLGKPSDLYRRIAMLLNNPQGIERRCPRGWAMLAAGGFLAVALLLSGIGWQRGVQAAPDDPKDPKDEPAKKFDLPKKEEKPPKPAPEPEDEFDKMFDNQLKNLDNIPPELREQMKKSIEDARKRMKEMRARGGLNFGNLNLPQMIPALPGQNFDPFNSTQGPRFQRLGTNMHLPSSTLVEQLDLPKDQGLVVGDVGVGSAAAKGGLKVNDILLELNGKPVSSDMREFRKMVAEIKSDTPIDAVVMRKGRRETIKGITLPEAKADDPALNAAPGVEQPLRRGVLNRIQAPNFPNLPALPNMPVPNFNNVFPGAGNTTSLSVSITNDQFTIDSHNNGLNINLTGKVEGDKAKVESIVIQDGNEKTSVDRLDRVPEKYREQVQTLLKRIEVQRK